LLFPISDFLIRVKDSFGDLADIVDVFSDYVA